jgi:hypothetical protein
MTAIKDSTIIRSCIEIWHNEDDLYWKRGINVAKRKGVQKSIVVQTQKWRPGENEVEKNQNKERGISETDNA